MTAIGEVTVDLIAGTATFDRNIAKSAAELRRFGARANQSLAGIEWNFSRITRAAGALGVGLGAAQLGSFARDALAGADALNDLAQRANIGVADLQGLQFAFVQFGASTRDVNDAVTRLNRRIGLFVQSGGGPAKAAIEELGLSLTDAGGKAAKTEDVIQQIVRRFESIPDPARRAALASQLFGEDAGPRLAVALSQGQVAIQELVAEAPKLDEALLNRASEINRAFENLTTRIGVELKNAILNVAVAASDAFDAASGDILKFGAEAEAVRGQIAKLEAELAQISGGGRGNARRRSGLVAQIEALRAQDPEAAIARINAEVERLQDSLSGNRRRRGAPRASVQRQIAELEAEAEKIRREAERAAQPAVPETRAPGVVAGAPPGRSAPRVSGRTRIEASLEREAEALKRMLRTDEERLAAQLAQVEKLREAGELTEAEAAELAQRTRRQFDTAAGSAGDMRDVLLDAGEGLASALSDGKLEMDEIVGLAANFAQQIFSGAAALSNLSFPGFGGGSVGGGGFDLGGIFGGVGDLFGGFFADGGRPPVGKVSVVGERGPELFVPDRAGTIVPNKMLGGAGGEPIHITVNVDARNSVATQEIVEQAAAEGARRGVAGVALRAATDPTYARRIGAR